MNIILCDDDREDRAVLEKHIARYCRLRDVHVSVRICPSASVLKEDEQAMDADVIFMDILMDGTDGMTAAEGLRDRGWKGFFVFATASRAHALKSFGVNVMDYLVKPISYERFARCMERLCMHLQGSLACLTVPVNGAEVRLCLREISMIETGGDHCVLIHLDAKTVRASIALSRVQEMLAPYDNFLRCHRSYIINMASVREIGATTVTLNGGNTALLTIRKAAAIRRHIECFLLEHSAPTTALAQNDT